MKSFSIAAMMAAAAFAQSYTTTYEGPSIAGLATSSGSYTWRPDVDADGNEVIFTEGSATFSLTGQALFEVGDTAEVFFCLADDKVCVNYQY